MNTRAMAITTLLLIGPAQGMDHSALVPVGELSHIHGVVLPRGSQDILLATHHGLYAVDAAGSARMISKAADDFMGFVGSPDGKLYASGHPQQGGNTGVIGAADQNSPWSSLASGANGPVDFHAMTVSPAEPNVLYGSYGGVQVSRDAGRTWTISGPGPDDLIDLAAAADEPGHLYAGTMKGLFESRDFGASWTVVAAEGQAVTSVEVASDGILRAFIAGDGLYALEGETMTELGVMTESVLLHMAFDSDHTELAVAVTQESEVLSTTDGGKSWSPLVP